MAASSSAIIAAADLSTDSAKSSSRRKRSKKTRQSVTTDLSTLTVDSSLLSARIASPAIASTSRTTIEAPAQADGAELPPNVATAIPQHLIQSKKRKRNHISSTEGGDAGNASTESEDAQTSTSLTLESVRRRRKKSKQTAIEHTSFTGVRSPPSSKHILPSPQAVPPALVDNASSSRASTSTGAHFRHTEPRISLGLEPVAAASAAVQAHAQSSSLLPDLAELDSSKLHNMDKQKKKKKKDKRAKIVNEATNPTIPLDSLPAEALSTAEASAVEAELHDEISKSHLLRAEASSEDSQESNAANSASVPLLRQALSFPVGQKQSVDQKIAGSTSSRAINLDNVAGKGQRRKVKPTKLSKGGQQGVQEAVSSAAPCSDVSLSPGRANSRRSEELLVTGTSSYLRSNGSGLPAPLPLAVNQSHTAPKRTRSVSTMTSPVRTSIDKSQPNLIFNHDTNDDACAGTTPIASTSKQRVNPYNMGLDPVQAPRARTSSPRIRLFDEESDTDLYRFEMREYDEDDTNHTDDEESGLYLPQPSIALSLGLRHVPSPMVADNTPSRKSRLPNSISDAEIAIASHALPEALYAKKGTVEASSSIMDAKQRNPPNTEVKSIKRLSYTTPSKIMQSLEGGRHIADASALTASGADDHEQQEINSRRSTDPAASGDSILPDFVNEQQTSAGVDVRSVAITFPKSPQSRVNKNRVSNIVPVVEIPVRRTSVPSSPRRSPNKLKQHSAPFGNLTRECTYSPAAAAVGTGIQVRALVEPIEQPSEDANAQIVEMQAAPDSASLEQQPVTPLSPSLSLSSASSPAFESLASQDQPLPPAEQPATSTLKGDEQMPRSRIQSFLDQLESDDEDDTSDDDSDDSTDLSDNIPQRRLGKRALPAFRRARRTESSSPEALSEQSDTDTEGINAGQAMPRAPEIQTADSMTSRQSVPQQNPSGTLDHDNHEDDESQRLLETIAQMVSSGEAAKGRGARHNIIQNENPESESAHLMGTSSARQSPAGAELQSATTVAARYSDFQDDPIRPSNGGESLHPTAQGAVADSLERHAMSSVVHLSPTPAIPGQVGTSLGLTLNEEHSPPVQEPHLASSANKAGQIAKDPLPIVEMQPATESECMALEGSHAQSPLGMSSGALQGADTASGNSMLSPSPDRRNIYPSLSGLDSEMSQPMFAALSTQTSPLSRAENSQMDELEQTQLLEQEPSVGRLRFQDFGPTPSPLQAGFDTASQIDELLQSSFDERSMAATDAHERETRGSDTWQSLDSESLSSDDSESDADIQRTFVKSQGTLPSPMIAAVGVSSNEDAGDNEVNSSQSPALQVHDNATLTLAQAASDLSATSEVSKDASWLDPTDVRSLPRPASSRAIPANGVRKANGIVPERHDISPPKKAMPIPSALPRSNSISAISTRFRGKLAERRNSGTVARTAPQAKITPVPTQSAHSSDSDSEDDSDSDSNVTPEQLPNGKERRIGLAALR